MGNVGVKSKKNRFEKSKDKDETMIIPVVMNMPTWTATDAANNIRALTAKSVRFRNDDNAAKISRDPAMEKLNKKIARRVRGKYEIMQSIGKGSFSRVWMVENRLTKKPFAMKVVKGKEGREIFETEISALSRIHHPNVVQLVETFETSQRFYLVMQLATGGDLFDRVVSQPHGRFDESNAARIIRMVMDGVRYLHRVGITHRDLKPDNLLFYHPGPRSNILITDFVIANVRKDASGTCMNTLCGSPEYLAPEMLVGKAYTSAVDMWSMGVVTYIVLSGSFPFDADDANQNQLSAKLCQLIVKGDYSFKDVVWKGISEFAKDFINKLLAVLPEKRMTAAEAIEHPWIRKHVGHVSEEEGPVVSSSSEENSYEDSTPNYSSESMEDKYRGKGKRKFTRRNQERLRILTERLIAFHSPRPL